VETDYKNSINTLRRTEETNMGRRHDKRAVACNRQFWLLFATNLTYERG